MLFIDKINILSALSELSCVELELGCGSNKRNQRAIGIDKLDLPGVDIVGDIYDVLAAFPAHSVDLIYSYHFVEHVPDVPRLLSDLARIMRPNGIVEFVAPHFSNPYYYSDPTHRSFYGLYTFSYYASHSPFARKVPTYGYMAEFQVKKVDLVFKSSHPFLIRHGLKLFIGSLFNSCNYLKEFYEENLCYLFPCYEVRYTLQRHELHS